MTNGVAKVPGMAIAAITSAHRVVIAMAIPA